MELDESGFPQPTGRFETLAADTVILALGQDTDTAFLRARARGGVRARRHRPVSELADDRVPGRVRGRRHGARRAHRDGRRRARQAGRAGDRRLAARDARPSAGQAPAGEFEMLNLWYFGDAARRASPSSRRRARRGFEEVVGGLSAHEATFEAGTLPVVRELLRVRRLPGRVPRGRGDQARPGLPLPVRLRPLHGCRACFEQCPVHSIEMFPERR